MAMRPDPSPRGSLSSGAFALNNKTAKMHRLVGLLQEAKHGMGLRHISSTLGVDERTAKRYLAEIRRLKFDLVQERASRGRPATYRIQSAGAPPTHFVTGLKKIRAELHAGGNPKYSTLISQLIRFLEAKEGRGVEAAAAGEQPVSDTKDSAGDIYYIDHGPFAEADPPPGILKILETAIATRTALRLTYSGYARPGSAPAEILFYPYVLSLRVGTLYLIGREGANRGPFKSLSVKRIRRALATPDAFKPDPFNAAEYYKYTFGQWARQLDESPETVHLALRAPWLEKFLSESHFNPPGKIIKRGKDTLFELKMVIKPDFVNWILSLTPDLIPLKPESLRQQVTDRLRQGLTAE